mmetsp:Transcript_87073/g.144826  ORF Transcript_87073/g.144826 Transcript_87073/m.144826 type:complete len:455 (+) Transcript_87073:104-1468(+)
MRGPLEGTALVTILNRLFEAGQQRDGPGALLEGHRHAPSLLSEHSVQKVDSQAPAEGREVQVVARADRKIQLRLEGVQDQVDLIHHQCPGLEEANDLRHVCDVLLQLLGPVARGIVDVPQELHEPQHDTLHGHAAGHDNAPVLDRALQFAHVRHAGLRGAVEDERVDALVHDGGEDLAEDAAGELQQGTGHDLHDQPVPVRQHQRQEGAHHRGLARPHDHLLHQRLAGPQAGHELPHECHLLLAQHDVPRELKHEEPGVVRLRTVTRHEMPPGEQGPGEGIGLLDHPRELGLGPVARQRPQHFDQVHAHLHDAVDVPNAVGLQQHPSHEAHAGLEHFRAHKRVQSRPILHGPTGHEGRDQELQPHFRLMFTVPPQKERVPVCVVLLLRVRGVDLERQLHVIRQPLDDGDGQRDVLGVLVFQLLQQGPEVQQMVHCLLDVHLRATGDESLKVRVQ